MMADPNNAFLYRPQTNQHPYYPSPQPGSIHYQQYGIAVPNAHQYNAGLPMVEGQVTTPLTSPWAPAQVPPLFPAPPPPVHATHIFPMAPPPTFLPTGFHPNPGTQSQPTPYLSNIPAHTRVQEVLDTDREEGELSDSSPATATRFLEPPMRSTTQTDVAQNPSMHRHFSMDQARNRDLNETAGFKPPHSQESQRNPRPEFGSQSTRGESDRPRDLLHRNSPPSSTLAHPRIKSPDLSAKRERAKRFLSLMHENGYTYEDFVEEGHNPSWLAELYRELNIPIVTDKNPPITKQDTMKKSQSEQGDNAQAQKPTNIPEIHDTRPTLLPFSAIDFSGSGVYRPPPPVITKEDSVPTRSLEKVPIAAGNDRSYQGDGQKKLPSVTGVKDGPNRAEYLAKLMELKSKSNSSAKQASPSTVAAGNVEAPKASKTVTQEPSSTSIRTPEQLVDDAARKAAEKKRAQTELARQKIEALAAARRATTTTPQVPQTVGLTISGATTSPAAPGTPSKTQRPSQAIFPTVTPTFTRIPGLFLASSSENVQPSISLGSDSFKAAIVPPLVSQANSSTTNEVTPQVVENANRKRPLSSDHGESSHAGTSAMFKRRFGQDKRYENLDEEMLIQASDDESTTSVMDIDDAPSKERSEAHSVSAIPKKQKSAQVTPSLTSFFSKPTGAWQPPTASSSTFSTPPAVQTPGSLRDLEVLRQQKEKELVATKQKLAELERASREKKLAEVKNQRKTNSNAGQVESPAAPKAVPSLSAPKTASPSPENSNTKSTINTPTGQAPKGSTAEATGAATTQTSGAPSAQEQDSSSSSRVQAQWLEKKRAKQEEVAKVAALMEELQKELLQIEAENQTETPELELRKNFTYLRYVASTEFTPSSPSYYGRDTIHSAHCE
ncbi:hypothetical protein M501DRAFT_487588 [Patellaria atrata CBS 101060]|uniref:Uncharacterized protein n=1 Tax=Patellaria atrata CBS 101060 TaxID=1346257 RepID=A0A9P4S252_9PEZI|nr:hypothetical protein M501DRAFT_487588 [Patellaria atrata CBS 101060]